MGRIIKSQNVAVLLKHLFCHSYNFNITKGQLTRHCNSRVKAEKYIPSLF